MLLIAMILEQNEKGRKTEYQRLSKQKQELMERRLTALAIQQDLRQEINGQSDPAWVELTLMKGLGLVPEGQRKVYFQKISKTP